jgi:hypothetical protein
MRLDIVRQGHIQSAHLANPLFLQRVAPGGTITGTGSPFPSTGFSTYKEPEEEPEVIRYAYTIPVVTLFSAISCSQDDDVCIRVVLTVPV